MTKLTEAMKAKWQEQRAERAAEIAAWKRPIPWRLANVAEMERYDREDEQGRPVRKVATTI